MDIREEDQNVPHPELPATNREEAVELLERELGWRDYGGEHYESIYTKFFQAHILPTKFGIDKRRPHYSSQVCAGHLTGMRR